MNKLLAVSFLTASIFLTAFSTSAKGEEPIEFIACPPLAITQHGILGTTPWNLRSKPSIDYVINPGIRIQGNSMGPFYLNKITVNPNGLQYSCQYSTAQITIPSQTISIVQWNVSRPLENVRQGLLYAPGYNFDSNLECTNNDEFPLNPESCKITHRK